jgi:hypothetical protein
LEGDEICRGRWTPTVFSDVDEQPRQKIGMSSDYLGSSQETLQKYNVKNLDGLFVIFANYASLAPRTFIETPHPNYN